MKRKKGKKGGKRKKLQKKDDGFEKVFSKKGNFLLWKKRRIVSRISCQKMNEKLKKECNV